MTEREFLHMEASVQDILNKTKFISELKIRPAKLGDETTLGRLYAEAYFELRDQLPPPKSRTLEDFRKTMVRLYTQASKEKHKNICTWMTEYSGVAVGFLTVKILQDFGYVGEIGVLPLYRRRGIAKALLHNFAIILKGRGIQMIKLDVNIKNTSAIKFYQSCGFKTIS